MTLLSRCHKFFHRLLDSDSSEVQFVARLAARDLRSNLGRNLQYMREETGLDPWVYGTSRIKEELIRHNQSVVPPSDVWRISLAEKLMNQRLIAFYQGDEDNYKCLNDILHSLVST